MLCSYIVLLVIKRVLNLHIHVLLVMSCTKWNYTAINMLFETKKKIYKLIEPELICFLKQTNKKKVNWLNLMKSYMCCFSTVFWETFKIVRNCKDALQCKRAKTYCINSAIFHFDFHYDFKNDNRFLKYTKYWIKNLNKWLTRQACNLKVYCYLYKMGQFKNKFIL